MQAHTKSTLDFAFLNNGSFIATVGISTESKRNACLWDVLQPPSQSNGFCFYRRRTTRRGLLLSFTLPDINYSFRAGRRAVFVSFQLCSLLFRSAGENLGETAEKELLAAASSIDPIRSQQRRETSTKKEGKDNPTFY